MNQLSRNVFDKIQSSGDLDFPGLKLQVYQKSKKIGALEWGKTYPYYDIASLTKIVFTTLWFMEALTQKQYKLDDPVQKFLPWYSDKSVKISQLLNHSAGNKWWQPFYKDISSSLEPEQAYQQMEKLCQKAPLTRDGKALYSDLDFYSLGSVMQKIEGRPLALIWKDFKSRHYPKTHFHFNDRSNTLYKKSQYAPTEKCAWRRKIMQGQVHDENAWALGGMAPHAGLFAKIEDLVFFGNYLRQIFKGQKSSLVSKKVFQKFTQRSLPKSSGHWGLGFMMPSLEGSSAGELMDRNSFGHTGFTGMSFWFDSSRDLFVVLMSNRVHPNRNNKGFVRLRPKIHNWILEELEGKK